MGRLGRRGYKGDDGRRGVVLCHLHNYSLSHPETATREYLKDQPDSNHYSNLPIHPPHI